MLKDELAKIDVNLKSVFTQGDFDYRDYLMLDEIVKQGKMDETDAIILNNIAVNLFKGYFKKVLDLELKEDKWEAEKNKFLHTLEFVLEKYIIEEKASV
jgi:hypothetical protein